MAKHLPPSAATLHLLDVGGHAGDILKQHRADLNIMIVTGQPAHWQLADNSFDAVVAYDNELTPDFLYMLLSALRPGGRLIVVNPRDVPDSAQVAALESCGYVRILVEPVPPGGDAGVLIRGEKVHTTPDTMTRVRQIAERDEQLTDLAGYRGRYVHLLVVQSPNKPAWALQPDEHIMWEALTIMVDDAPVLLAFSSLPRAVSFMQQAVVAGTIQGINKMPKFTRELAQSWSQRVILNPAQDVLDNRTLHMLPINPDTAEAPDE